MVAIIAAIAIPNILRTKITGNETRVLAFLKAYAVGAEQYNMLNSVYPQRYEAFGGTPPWVEDPGFNDLTFCCGDSMIPAPQPPANSPWRCPRLVFGYKFIFYRKGMCPGAGTTALYENLFRALPPLP